MGRSELLASGGSPHSFPLVKEVPLCHSAFYTLGTGEWGRGKHRFNLLTRLNPCLAALAPALLFIVALAPVLSLCYVTQVHPLQ